MANILNVDYPVNMGLEQRRCEALPTMHCDLGATLYIIDFSALVAHCSAGLRSVRRSVN